MTSPTNNKLSFDFSFHEAYGYSQEGVKGFLRRACTDHSGYAAQSLTEQEKEDLNKLWNEIFKPYFSPDCPRKSCSCANPKWPLGQACCEKQVRITVKRHRRRSPKFKLDPVIVQLRGTKVSIFSLHCALAAVLTITLVPPSAASQKYHDYAWCLIALLGKWSWTIVGGQDIIPAGGVYEFDRKKRLDMCPRMVCVMYGTASADSDMVLWSCGTTKLFELDNVRKGLKNSWRESREEMVNKAIGLSFTRLQLPGSQPPGTIQDSKAFVKRRVLLGPDWDAGRAIHQIFTEKVSLTSQRRHLQRFGDCAESVPITIAANTCAGILVSISLQPEIIIGKISGISRENTIECYLEPKPGCDVCQWWFAGIHVKKNILVKDQSSSQAQDTLELVEILSPLDDDTDMDDDMDDDNGMDEDNGMDVDDTDVDEKT